MSFETAEPLNESTGGIDAHFIGDPSHLAFYVNTSAAYPIVKIFPDGRVELGPNITPDVAAKAFWNAVREHAPRP